MNLRRSLIAATVATLIAGSAFLAISLGSSAQALTGAAIPTSIARSDEVTAFDVGSESAPVCTPARLGQAKQVVEQDLSNRVTQLQILSNRVSNSKSMSAPDAASLDTIISNEKSGIVDGGIVGLQTMVSNATTCLQVISDAEAMVVDFRVYALASPQVDLTAVAAAETKINSVATTEEPKVQQAISAAQQQGKNVGGAETAYSNLVSAVANSVSEVGEVPVSSLLAEQPSEYPTDASTLVGYHEDLVAAGSDLRSAYEDFQTIISDLRS